MEAHSSLARTQTRVVRVTTTHKPSARLPAPTFDRDVARQAWRQFARNRGAFRGYGGHGHGRVPMRVWFAIVVGVGLGFALWFGGAALLAEAPSSPSSGLASGGAAETRTSAPAPASKPLPPVRSSRGFTADTRQITRERLPVRAARPSLAALALGSKSATEEPEPAFVASSVARPTREATQDVSDDAPPMSAEALKSYGSLPTSSSDRPPVGGVGDSGIHVDRIGAGTVYNRDGCDGPSEAVSLQRASQVHVCFRVVHQRAAEKVTVLWEHDGSLVRRTFMNIPAHHAYRTRAGLGLRKAYIGSWAARVVDENGVELARTEFDVVH